MQLSNLCLSGLSRREFLKQAAETALAVSVAPVRLCGYAPPTLGHSTSPKRVLVLGAGLAGLVAADELTQAGHDVTVLEASQRAGGRIRTLREEFSDGLYAEAGAGRIPDWHELTLKYVKIFGLTLDPFYPTQGSSVYVIRSRRIVVPSGGDLDVSNLPFALTQEERRGGLDRLLRLYVDPVLKTLGDPTGPGWPPDSLKQYDQMNFREFLRRRGASPGAVDLMTALSGWEEEDSALDFLRDDLSHRGAKTLYKIRGGMDLLPRAFASRLAERIRYHAPVVRIEQDARGVRAVTQEAGSHQTHAGDYLICAIPYTCLRHVEAAPAFSLAKQKAINEVRSDPVVRVFVQTRKKFWEKDSLNGFADTDESLEIWNPTFDQTGPRGILLAYAEDGLARRVNALAPSGRVGYGVSAIEKAYPGLRAEMETAFQFSWADQPWSRGAYTYFEPGQLLSLSPVIRQPEGRIYFAGEHASDFPGWMQGALESGLRAARQVHEAS